MADGDAAAELRRKAAEARKAKIASRGADRLAKITSTARGGDAAAERFGSDISSSSRPSTPVAVTSSHKPTSSASTSSAQQKFSSPIRQTLPDLAAPSFDPLDDPPEIDISQAASRSRANNNSLASFPGAVGQDGQMPDMFSMLFGGGPGQGDASNGMGGNGLPPGFDNLASLFGGAAGASPMMAAPPKPKSWTDRLQPLVHVMSMVFLAFYAVFVLEPKIRHGYGTSLLSLFTNGSQAGLQNVGDVDINGWAALGRGKQAGSGSSGLAQAIESSWEASGRGVATVQITYVFLVVELLLQSVALTLFKSRPPIPGLLGTISTYLPPQYAAYLHTGMRYYALLGQILDDLAVLVLSLVGWILFAEYKQFGWASVGKVKLQ